MSFDGLYNSESTGRKSAVLEELGISMNRLLELNEAVGSIGAKHIASRKFNKVALIQDIAAFNGSEVEKLLIMEFIAYKIGTLV